mmetsp:Transcript_51183/g.102653  ORF Transcript_51183/g.102653 Transcript_51183/m.102653 type:complete len:91 (+) Transcript_51183:51-323(+)
MSAMNKALAFITIGASSAGVVAAAYSNEKAAQVATGQSLHSEKSGVLTPEQTRALSRQEVVVARQEAGKLLTRNSGNYYGLITGEYAEAK